MKAGWTFLCAFLCVSAFGHTARTRRCAFLLTHQIDALMAATEERLAGFGDVPVVILRADSFGKLTPVLAARADTILMDLPRRFPLDADEVHLAGGYLDRCLKVSAIVVTETVFREGRRRLTLVVHADLTYTRDGTTLWSHYEHLELEEGLRAAAIAAGRAFFPNYDRTWKVTADPTRYTDGTNVVEIHAVIGGL